MRLHRFISPVFDFSNKSLKITDQELINQFRKVLRFKKGDRVILGNGKLEEVMAEIDKMNEEFVIVKILEFGLNKNEPQTHTILYCSILKRENFELVAQKATEIGIKEIVPIISQRTVKLDLKKDRLEKIIREAAEQSSRGVVPVMHKALVFEKALEQAASNELNLFFDFSGGDFDKAVLAGKKKVGIFIGPEGGWEDKEAEKVRKIENFKIFNLGKLSLKAETAAIIGSYFVVHN
jgi:16S rRNA (uracil1498-N3)-methyltransferase